MEPSHRGAEACGWDEVREALCGWRALEGYLPETERPLPWTPPSPAFERTEAAVEDDQRRIQKPTWLEVRVEGV